MSRNTQTVETYRDGFRKNDHARILSCLTDDIEWTVFGAFHLKGKEAYDAAIEGPLSAFRSAVEHHLSGLGRLPPPARDAAIGQVRDAAGAVATPSCRLSPALADVLTGSAPEPSSAGEPTKHKRT